MTAVALAPVLRRAVFLRAAAFLRASAFLRPAVEEIVEKIVERVVHRAERVRLPDERPSITHKFSIAGHEGYLHIGLYPDTHMPGEIFITMAKEGSTLRGLTDTIAVLRASTARPMETRTANVCARAMRWPGGSNSRCLPRRWSLHWVDPERRRNPRTTPG